MRAKLGFAIAVHADPDILLIDEVVAAGDEKFRQRVGTVFDQMKQRQCTIVFVTHSMPALQQYCSSGLWMEHGRVYMAGGAQEVAEAYVEAAKAG